MKRWRFLSIIILLFSALLVILLANRPDAETASASTIDVSKGTNQQQTANNNTFANCRYGAAPLGQTTAVISRLGAGWYLNFGAYAPNPPPENDADFAHMFFVRQNKDEFVYLPGYKIKPALDNNLATLILNNPGDLWIIGNEVDRGPNPGEPIWWQRVQGDTHPEIYAIAYHDAYEFIKGVDPTAQVAISGLVEVTPGRLQYLDKVWNAYLQQFNQPMPVDMWTMHLYILSEVDKEGAPNGIANVALGTDPALGKRESGGDPAACSDPDVYCFAEHDDMNVFAEQIVAMRQWMAEHGQREKPLLITEYSILWPYEVDEGGTCHIQDENGNCFTPKRVNDFMNLTFDYLNTAKDANLGYSLDKDRLIQQYMWFSVYSPSLGAVSNLVEEDLVTFTSLGQNFKDHVINETPTQNLLVDQVANVVAIAPPGGTATAEISVIFRNSGNTKVKQPFTVTFYEDAALTKPIGAVEISADVLGCTSRPYVASVEWSGLAEGAHKFWVKIDSGDAIDEGSSGNNDNIGSALVMVPTDITRLPIIRR